MCDQKDLHEVTREKYDELIVYMTVKNIVIAS